MADTTTDNLTHRLTKVEASTIALEHSINNFIKASGEQVRSLSDNIQRVAEQSSRDRTALSNDLQNLALRQASGGKPNWAAVAVGISIFSLVMGFGAYAVSTVEARINRLEGVHLKEVERNRAMEYEAGRQSMASELLLKGRPKE